MTDYGVDTRVGPVPVPVRAKKLRPVNVVASDGTVKRETDTEAILPLMYRVFGLEVVTREDADVKIVECKDCGLAFRKLGGTKRCAACLRKRALCACGAKKKNESARCKACLTPEQQAEWGRKGARASVAARTPEQRSDASRRANAARTPEQRSDVARMANAALTSKQRSDAGKAMTPEQRSEAMRKANAARTPEQRSDVARNAAATRWAKRKAAE